MAEPENGPKIGVRIANLEANYSRSADGMKRIADANEATHGAVKTLTKTLIGYIDKEKNKFVEGYISIFDGRITKVEDQQNNCLEKQQAAKKSKKGRIKQLLLAAKDIAVFVTCGFLAIKFGLK